MSLTTVLQSLMSDLKDMNHQLICVGKDVVKAMNRLAKAIEDKQ